MAVPLASLRRLWGQVHSQVRPVPQQSVPETQCQGTGDKILPHGGRGPWGLLFQGLPLLLGTHPGGGGGVQENLQHGETLQPSREYLAFCY